MPYLIDLANACRQSGLPVIEVAGWKTRGHGNMSDVRTIVCHHTAGAATGNYPSLGIVRDGRPDLPGPLSQLGLGRDGTVYVIAAGLSYHAGVVRNNDYSNAYAIGIEAEATGVTTWPRVQMDAYAALCAALCEHYRIKVANVLGHKEVCDPPGRKVDPNFDMSALRAAIQEDDMPLSDADKAWMRDAVRQEIAAARAEYADAAQSAVWSRNMTVTNNDGLDVKRNAAQVVRETWEKTVKLLNRP